ncbi:MAG TPA: P-II family nitrogen regulator [Ruminiclostridium sp.]|nr:P-II family nitrogen regulator [Ruminiclostridium sp.]
MKKIEAIIRPGKLEEIKDALAKFNIKGLTITQVMGCGHQKGITEVYRGAVIELKLLQKLKVEIVTTDEKVDEIVKVLSETAKTGEIGDGKIFIYNIEDVIRIRTGERGESAI